MGNEDLGKHFERIGQLSEATEAYNRMRQDASTTKHVITCGMLLSNVALLRRDWSSALNNINKVAGVQDHDDESKWKAYAKVVSGVAYLGMGQLPEAARSFLQTDSSVPSSEYSHIASPNDIAIYGGLLVLATIDRKSVV